MIISFDTEDFATVNDWVGNREHPNGSIDAYKAFIEKGILVMPADNTDLRSPYCEIVRQDKSLLYRCRSMFTKDKKFVEQDLFVRE